MEEQQWYRVRDGLRMFASIGRIIDDEGYSHHEDIWIEGVDEEKLELIYHIFAYMRLEKVEEYYDFSYRDERYLREKERPMACLWDEFFASEKHRFQIEWIFPRLSILK